MPVCSKRLHLPDGRQSDGLVLGGLAVLDDIEDGIAAKPTTFAFVTTLAVGLVIKPGSDQVCPRFLHVARVSVANNPRSAIGASVRFWLTMGGGRDHALLSGTRGLERLSPGCRNVWADA